MNTGTDRITEMILKARKKVAGSGDKDTHTQSSKVQWPMECTVGPGLEGAIACESRVGYVNGSRGKLIYRGYDIFDLCAYSTFEEVSYLLLHGRLPTAKQLDSYKQRLVKCRSLPSTLRHLMGFPVEEMNTMSALRLGVNMMRQRLTWRDMEIARPSTEDAIASDEDSIAMETEPAGQKHAIYEFRKMRKARPEEAKRTTDDAAGIDSCMRLIAGIPTVTACIARVREDKLPIEPDPELGHAANFLYMLSGKRPTPEMERIMDVVLILHADHGMPASTFASMVVASTLSDIYFSVGAGIAALNGPLHGGANEAVVRMLREIESADAVDEWYRKARRRKQRISGFGHRVYKVYDPRARILGPLAGHLAKRNSGARSLYRTARALERKVIATLGSEKGIFPNVDFYSGIVYSCMDIPVDLFTPIFAVSRVAGWTARILEYLHHNRIFRPRAMYTGDFDEEYVPLSQRR